MPEVKEDDPNKDFYEKTTRALKDLCEKAKAKQELHFATSLIPEIRGMQGDGWSTAEDAKAAYDQYSVLLDSMKKDDVTRVRVALAFYLQLAEGAGFYEIPKKMMLTIEGKGNNIYPFQHLVKKHRRTGVKIAPNANSILKDLMGHAYELGLHELSDVFKDAFDGDVRNAIAHSDYILAKDGMRLRKRNGGDPYVIPWPKFNEILDRGIAFFSIMRHIADEYVESYNPPKTIQSRLAGNEPIGDYTVFYDPIKEQFGWTTGKEPPKGFGGRVAVAGA
jgi:hypothetical protein